ncbi:2,4-dienoyl-CoA reductase [Sporobacter termitidis DSM 10068]|uniref:2,4-dienoyl-CoA reductase n=1 Tax=Sporobacter termitidis DSM 10068 TaxID=1123282 RepID=A0A1M5YEK4_9FIRM|nr:FAD-dependent oxidoreductase [Sporobacter termitidis]SHI09953.1 2,4-dienoyl-CoA reductase [Sporobacter termitidis DSM 10068]
MLRYPHLFEPIRLGKTTFRNRMFASPISERALDSRNRPNNDCIAFYEQKAMGGAASVCVGDCVVDTKNGLFGEFMVHLDDPGTHHALNLLSAAVTRQGAVASVELQHAGLYAYGSRAAGSAVYGPCAGVDSLGNEYQEMPEEIIEKIIASYAGAAAWAKLCGFGMVTVHGGHGWLLSQFMSSKVNLRGDKWGGSLENRMRLPLAVIDAIRKSVGPGFPIEIRISGSEVTPMGYDLDEGIAIAKMLDGHVDLIHVSAGHHERKEVFTVTHPSIFSPDSANIGYAAAIKKHVKTPVASVGAHCDPELLEEIIASKKADVVEMARALMADPDLVTKARMGKPEEIRPCLRCLACFSNLITNGQIYCAVNPMIGREPEYRCTPVPAVKKTVLVAGGGVGGMQAALGAAKAGHRVILCEKSGRLGGALRCEETVSFKSKIRDYLAYQARQMAKSPVDVRLNTAVTPALASELRPDVIIAALGARPTVPPVKGIDGDNVLSAEEVYDHPEKVGQKAVVLGGGLVGVELAIHLAALGRAVTILEMMPALNSGGNILHQLALDGEIDRRGIALALGTRAVEITGRGVVGVPAGEEGGAPALFEADTVIYAIGQTPLWAEADALRESAPEFYMIGDCHVPKNIMQATSMADAAVRNIGRVL